MAALLRRHALRGASTQPRVPTAAPAPTAPSRAALPRLQQPRRATGRSLSFSTAEDGTMTFYSSQSGVTVEIPAGIHLHDVGLASLGQQQGAEAEELWGTALAAYSMSDNIRSVELGEGAEPGAVAAQLTQHGETAAVVVASDAAEWGSEACQVVVRAAVGKVDGLDPDDSAQDAIDAAADAVSDVRPPLPTRPPPGLSPPHAAGAGRGSACERSWRARSAARAATPRTRTTSSPGPPSWPTPAARPSPSAWCEPPPPCSSTGAAEG